MIMIIKFQKNISYKKCRLVYLSSRKIYKPDNNIKENGIFYQKKITQK